MTVINPNRIIDNKIFQSTTDAINCDSDSWREAHVQPNGIDFQIDKIQPLIAVDDPTADDKYNRHVAYLIRDQNGDKDRRLTAKLFDSAESPRYHKQFDAVGWYLYANMYYDVVAPYKVDLSIAVQTDSIQSDYGSFRSIRTEQKNVMAITRQRSTLNRSGVQFRSGIYDTGFKGPIAGILQTGPCDIFIGIDTPIAQIVFFEAEAANYYDGHWQQKN